jgi:hypothetical protein
MNNHVPDLERCKRLEKAGFQGLTQFVWVRNEMKEWRVITVWENTWTELLDSPFYRVIRAPIVTELLAEVLKLTSDKNLYLNIYDDSALAMLQGSNKWRVADTLPNALADLWCWLAEREA